MKSAFFAVLGLLLISLDSSVAQDPTVTTPTERSEAAAAATPAPSRTTRPEAPAESASPEPKTSSSPASARKPAALAAPSKETSAKEILRDLETRWVASIAKHDPTVAEQVLAEDYAGVSAAGKAMDKRTVVAQIQKDPDTYESAKVGKMDIRIWGNVAVITGTSREKGKDNRGERFERSYRWTDTWLQRNGKWQCIASQSAQVPK